MAAQLLGQLVHLAQGTNGYGAAQASRWIRCIVPLIIDAEDKEVGSPTMKLAEEAIEQAIVLASTRDSRAQEREDHGKWR
jgi:hypothetical protein